jgi:hypothetical protein
MPVATSGLHGWLVLGHARMSLSEGIILGQERVEPKEWFARQLGGCVGRLLVQAGFSTLALLTKQQPLPRGWSQMHDEGRLSALSAIGSGQPRSKAKTGAEVHESLQGNGLR